MGNRNLYPDKAYGIDIVRAYARVLLPGSGTAGTIQIGKTVIKSVVHVGGTNVCTVTLQDSYPNLILCDGNVRDDAGNGSWVAMGTITGEGSTTIPPAPITFKITSFVAGGGVNNDDAHVVGLELVFLNTNITAGN